MTIGENVKGRRKAKRWTQTELALKTDGVLTQAMISKLEAGAENITIFSLRALAHALGCRVVDLLPDEDKKRP